jgi:hypothetical protein
VDKNCIGVADAANPETILRYATEMGIHHVVQKQGYCYDHELATAQHLVRSPDSFRTLPIASVFTPGDLTPQAERRLIAVEEFFNASSQKRGILDKAIKSLESKGLSQTLIEDVILVADEMFTNAVYNAPFVDPATQNNPGINRHNVEVQYIEGKHSRLFLAHDNERLLIGCEDPFGSLNLPRWLSKIKETYLRGPAATMNFGPGGAGLGSYIIFNAGTSLYLGVWPGQSTTLACVLPMGMSNRKRGQLPKHLHWIQR